MLDVLDLEINVKLLELSRKNEEIHDDHDNHHRTHSISENVPRDNIPRFISFDRNQPPL